MPSNTTSTSPMELIYPLAVTGIAQVIFPAKANGQLLVKDGQAVGSSIIGQPFSSPGCFRSRPSAAGAAGYDAGALSGSNLGPTNKKLIDRVMCKVEKLRAENPGQPIPVDLVTTSAAGLDPHLSPAAAEFQIPRIAKEREMRDAEGRSLVQAQTQGRQFGFLVEAGVHVLELNVALDARSPMRKLSQETWLDELVPRRFEWRRLTLSPESATNKVVCACVLRRIDANSLRRILVKENDR